MRKFQASLNCIIFIEEKSGVSRRSERLPGITISLPIDGEVAFSSQGAQHFSFVPASFPLDIIIW
jgi:hypothetical protein